MREKGNKECRFILQVSFIIDEYRCGRTPNPDVLCNTRVKFGLFSNALIHVPSTCYEIINKWVGCWLGAFVDAVSGMAFDFIASGHYAMVVHPNSGNKDEPSTLRLSKDMVS